MSCTCNASALKLFTRGLAQVHRLESGAQRGLLTRGASGAHLSDAFPVQRRSLHASRALRDAESDAKAPNTPEQPSKSTEGTQSSESSPTTKPANKELPRRRKTHEESIAEARSKAAWRFKQQGFDWKAFRSKDPEVRAKIDFSNFDWKNWEGKKHGVAKGKNSGLNQMVDNLEAARLEDRAAVGLAPREGGVRDRDYRKRSVDPTRRATARRDTARTEESGLPPRKKEDWMIQKEYLKAKFPEGWKPHKRLSPDALAGIRALNAQFPDVYTTQTLADKFAMSAEAIRRILKSKWTPSPEEEEDRQERWHRRGVSVWARKAELGIKPPQRWRDEGIAREPEYHERKANARTRRDDQVRAERETYMKSFNNHRNDASRGEGRGKTAGTERYDGSQRHGTRRSSNFEKGSTAATEEDTRPWWGNKVKDSAPGDGGEKKTAREMPEDLLDHALTSGRRD